MIKISIGKRTVETSNEEKPNWESLANNQSNQFLISLLSAQCREEMDEIRHALDSGESIKANKCHGRLEQLEDIIELLSTLSEQLKPTDNEKLGL